MLKNIDCGIPKKEEYYRIHSIHPTLSRRLKKDLVRVAVLFKHACRAHFTSVFAQHSHDEDDGAENSQDVMTEIDSYLARRCIGALEDPLEFWKDHQKDYTHLGRIARRYLAAPATSIASESTFSVARDVFDYKRSRLSPQNAEMLIFLHRNLPLISFNY
uniref:HAT C-terminal dimerisation domain-containing protein n=1 Tax=Ditylenchus dipsaci TaxID=166011 RepID=A0A915D1D5_9BILA